MAKPAGDVFDSSWRQACSVGLISRSTATPMIRKHYLGKWPGVTVLSLGLFRNERALGVIVFALPPRETSVRYGGVTWELARLWVSDEVPANAETFLISRAVKYIKRHRPEVVALVSYADPSVGHQGVIYKAANWSVDGRTDEGRKTPRCDYMANGKRYSRRRHVPDGVEIERVPRVSKARFVLRCHLNGC